MYCQHRWGLIEIGRVWLENYFVTKANLLHEHVHDEKCRYFSSAQKVFHSVSVYLDDEPYNIYGVVDCLEAVRSNAGTVKIDGIEGKYSLNIVEYKPSKPKNALFNEEDLMQVFAQKLCVDHLFNTDCEAYVYYADVKKRIRLPLRENYQLYDSRLKEILAEMRGYMERGFIPHIEKGQKCSGCSFEEMCMPKAVKSRLKMKDVILSALRE